MDTESGNGGAGWLRLVEEAPELARQLHQRFVANLHHVIGTIRADGSPRLSGTEVTIEDGEVTIGMMPRSRKLDDVRRDPRVEIHSAPLEEDLALGDAKLTGTLVELASPAQGPPGSYFRLELRSVSLVRVDGDQLELTTWGPGRGVGVTRRR